MKKLLFFTLLLCCSAPSFLNAQMRCGVLPPHTASSTNPDKIYFDRFGNSYDLPDEDSEPSVTSAFTQIGFFGLSYTNTDDPGGCNGCQSIFLEHKNIIEDVFLYVSGVIQQRNSACGGSSPIHPVNINIIADISDNDVYGIGTANYYYSPFYNPAENENCREIKLSAPFVYINGGHIGETNDPLYTRPAGNLHLNLASPIDWYLNDGTIGSDQVDFYSVVLHEVLHILGFDSQIGDSEMSSEIISLWDKNLHLSDDFDESGNNSTLGAILTSDCAVNCWNLNNDLFPVYQDLMEASTASSCLSTSTDVLVFGETGLAPLAGGSDTDLAFDHLSDECDSYVVSLSPPIGTLEKRIITDTELDILCALGYETSNCDGCFAISNYDAPYSSNIQPPHSACCENRFIQCLSDGDELIPFVIPITDLFCNDVNNSDVTISDIWIHNSGEEVEIIGDNIVITPNVNSAMVQCSYTINSCDCNMSNNSFTVLFQPCGGCTENIVCDNLFCFDDFEDVAIGRTFLNHPFQFDYQSLLSMPEVNNLDGNNYLALNYGNSIALELSESILPGNEIELTFSASHLGNFPVIQLEIFQSEDEPCDVNDSFVNFGCVQTICSDHIYNPSCISAPPVDIDNFMEFITVPNDELSGYDVIITDLNLETYTVNWTNEEDYPVNFIMISAASTAFFALDNLSITKSSCLEAGFTTTPDPEDCLTFCFSNIDSECGTDFNHNWDFGGTGTSTENPVCHTFPSSGTYPITHYVTDDCGNVDTYTEEVIVQNCTIDCDNCPTDAIIISGEASLTTLIDDGTLFPFAQAATIPQNLFIEQALFIDQSYPLAPGSEICMAPGARIFVTTGNFQPNQTYFHGCDRMWQGIKLATGADIYARNCVFEDAAAAIQTGSESSVTLIDNTFHKNLIGILHPPSASNTFVTKFHGNNFNCTDAFLLPPYDGQPGEIGSISYAGIVVFDDNPILVAEDNVSSGDFVNVMEDMSNGIVAHNSGLEIEGIRFANIEPNNEYTISGFGVYARGSGQSITQVGLGQDSPIPTFDNCRTGIYIQNMDANISENSMQDVLGGVFMEIGQHRTIEIYDNDIQSTSTGIALVQTQLAEKIRVQRNRITLEGGANNGQACIAVFEMSGYQDDSAIQDNDLFINKQANGILMAGAAKHNVIGNDITLNSNFAGRGIALQGCAKMKISCNQIFGSKDVDHIGLNVLSTPSSSFLMNTFDGTRRGARFQSDCNSTTFRTNDFQDNNISLELTETAVMGTEIGGQVHQGNTWDENSTAQHSGNDMNILLSGFTVHNLDSEYAPDNILNIGGSSLGNWFLEDEQGSPAPGNPAYCDLLLLINNQGTTDLDKELAKDNVSVEIYNEEVKWVAEKTLYRKLDDDPSLITTDADLQSFYNAKSSESIGQFTSIDKNSLSIHEVDNSTAGQIASLKTAIDNYRMQLKALTNSVSDNPTEAELNDLKIAQSLIYSELEIQETQLKLLNEALKSGKVLSSENVRISNEGISVTEVYEQNEKLVNSIYLRTVARGNTDFTSSETSQLFLIASICPLAGGNAVFNARSLYALIDFEITFDDDDICNASGFVLSLTPDNNNLASEVKEDKTPSEEDFLETVNFANFSVQPNPVSSNLFVEYTLTEQTTGQLFVYDLIGKVISNKLLVDKAGRVSLDVSSWSEGIYWIELRLSNGSNTIQKVSVLR